MGYSLSVQVIALLVASLSPVFFPVLRKIPPNETEKIQNVLVKLVMVFSIFGMSFSLLQASIAGPLIRLFLEDKWIDTILIVQILSIGIGFNVACTVWAVSLRLREKFKKMAILSLTSAIVFLCIIITFTKMFNILGTAVGVSLYNIVINISLLIISLRRYKVKAISIFKILFSYFFLSLIIFYSCYYLTNKYVLNDWIRIFTSGILPTLIYFAILYFFDANSKKIFNMLLKKINIKKSI